MCLFWNNNDPADDDNDDDDNVDGDEDDNDDNVDEDNWSDLSASPSFLHQVFFAQRGLSSSLTSATFCGFLCVIKTKFLVKNWRDCWEMILNEILRWKTIPEDLLKRVEAIRSRRRPSAPQLCRNGLKRACLDKSQKNWPAPIFQTNIAALCVSPEGDCPEEWDQNGGSWLLSKSWGK